MADSAGAPERIPPAVWLGSMIVIVGVFVRAVCAAEPFPFWDSDPFRFAPPITGLTPTWALVLNGLIILGSMLTIARLTRGIGNAPSILLASGFLALAYHASVHPETASEASDIGASLAVLVCAWAVGQHAPIRGVMIGAALGFGVLLAAIGAVQIFVEHPATLASFELTRDDFYAARGWDPDGPKAAMYEERLSHADPSAAFGLTNVFATFAGASAAGLIVCAAMRGLTLARRVVFVAAAAVSCWALLSTGSKGGIGAFAAAMLTVVVARRVRPGWVGRAVLFAAIGVVAAVAVRGLLGETFGERSLLFRSQYQQGTWSVFKESPLIGTGPGQFQEAYTRLKPADAPEDVSSPHSVWFDWLGMLGVAGIALFAATAIGWWRRETDAQEAAPSQVNKRVLARLACLAPACAMVASTLVLRETMTPERALAIVGGSVAWSLIAAFVATAKADLRIAALVVGAIALVHGQLDVSPVWAVSAPAWGLLVGCGMSALAGPERPARARWVLVASGFLLCVVLAWRGIAITRWESALTDAARIPARIGQLRTEIGVAGPGILDSELRSIAAELDAMLGATSPTPPRASAIQQRLDMATLIALDPAAEDLRRALEARPTHHPTRVALSRVLGMIAARDANADPEAATRVMDEAVALASAGTELDPESAAAWAWLANTRLQRAGWAIGNTPDQRAGWLREAAAAFSTTAGLNPRDPDPPASVAEILADLGNTAESAVWALRAIELDDRLRLDPKRRLNAARRAALERLAGADG